MDGSIHGTVNETEFALKRTSLFDESSSCIHVSANTNVEIHCDSDTEFTVYSCDNEKQFEARVYRAEDVANEPRGKGQVNDRCLRYVRTIFDGTTADPNAELVLGEVITFQGGWSSYPPHHHPQPEIYHYRFTEPQGYGLGINDLKVIEIRNVLVGIANDQNIYPDFEEGWRVQAVIDAIEESDRSQCWVSPASEPASPVSASQTATM